MLFSLQLLTEDSPVVIELGGPDEVFTLEKLLDALSFMTFESPGLAPLAWIVESADAENEVKTRELEPLAEIDGLL